MFKAAIGAVYRRAKVARSSGGAVLTAVGASFSNPNITITATTSSSLAAGRFGAAISVNGGASVWYDGVGAASSQSLVLSLTDIAAVAGDLIGIDPGYSLTDPATTKVYGSASGLYITPSITTPTISDTSPTVGDTLTGTNGTALTRLSATRSVLWLADGSSTGDTDSSYDVVSGDIGKVLTYRNTTSDGGSATSAATDPVVDSGPDYVQMWKNETPASPIAVTVSGVTAHNSLIAVVAMDTSNTDVTWAPGGLPTGFVNVGGIHCSYDGGTTIMAVKKDCDGTEGALSFTNNIGSNAVLGVYEFSGLNNSTIEDFTVSLTADNTGQASPWSLASDSKTPAHNNCLIVASMHPDVGSASAPTTVFTTSSGSSGAWTTIGLVTDGNQRLFAFGYAVQSTAGALTITGTQTAAGKTAGSALIVYGLRAA